MNSGQVLKIGTCVDRAGVGGLEVMLRSLVYVHSGLMKLEVHVLHKNLPGRTIRMLSDIVNRETGNKINWIDFDPRRFFRGNPVFGLMSYSRIFLPEVSGPGRLLYLDTDVLVIRELVDAATVPICKTFAAVREKEFGRSNCKPFFRNHGADLETPYFNAGVLLIDCDRWCRDLVRERLLETGEDFNWEFPSGDQTLLNYHFAGRFDPLPAEWNCLAYASADPIDVQKMKPRIVHFIGRPKPWECFGWLNRQFPTYVRISRAVLGSVAPAFPDLACWMSSARRVVRYGPAYIKCAASRFRALRRGQLNKLSN